MLCDLWSESPQGPANGIKVISMGRDMVKKHGNLGILSRIANDDGLLEKDLSARRFVSSQRKPLRLQSIIHRSQK